MTALLSNCTYFIEQFYKLGVLFLRSIELTFDTYARQVFKHRTGDYISYLNYLFTRDNSMVSISIPQNKAQFKPIFHEALRIFKKFSLKLNFYNKEKELKIKEAEKLLNQAHQLRKERSIPYQIHM